MRRPPYALVAFALVVAGCAVTPLVTPEPSATPEASLPPTAAQSPTPEPTLSQAGGAYVTCADGWRAKADLLIKKYNANLTSLKTLASVSKQMVDVYQTFLDCIQVIAWPPAVAADEDNLNHAAFLVLKVWSLMSQQTTDFWFERYALGLESAETSAKAAAIRLRRELGLPQTWP